jgi:uncharacterized protein (TIGR02145 family)
MKTNIKIETTKLILVGILLFLNSSCQKENEPSMIKDKDGNIYTSVTIGTQIWMVENLKTTKYNDGTDIPLVTDNTAWSNLTTPAYCWYNNEIANKTPYGALYNWYAVNTGKLCPSGWHVPLDTEWGKLYDYLGGGLDVDGGKLKETGTTHWNSPNTGATNETGFTALPGGDRYINGAYYNIGVGGFWWSSTEYTNAASDAWVRSLYYASTDWVKDHDPKGVGFSVRCLKD